MYLFINEVECDRCGEGDGKSKRIWSLANSVDIRKIVGRILIRREDSLTDLSKGCKDMRTCDMMDGFAECLQDKDYNIYTGRK